MLPPLQKLSEVLEKVAKLDYGYELYMAGDYPWSKDDICAVMDRNDPEQFEDPDDEEPLFARRTSLKCVFIMHEVHSIVNNARQQESEVMIDELVDAFNYYYKHDAFINFSKLHLKTAGRIL